MPSRSPSTRGGAIDGRVLQAFERIDGRARIAFGT
jgi:hypothetical protein